MGATADTFQSGYAAYRRGDYAQARSLLEKSRQTQAAHLLGLVERHLGNYVPAAAWLAKAAGLEPRNHEIPHNQALLELDNGKAPEAEGFARQALALNPGFGAARNTLGRSLILQKRWPEAAEVYTQQLRADPANLVARFGMATVQLETGQDQEALTALDQLIAENHSSAAILFMRGRARQQLGLIGAALDDLRASYALDPTAQTLRELGNLLWMTADTAGLDDLLNHARGQPQLTAIRAELLRQRGTPDEALAALLPGSVPRLGADELAVKALAYIDNENIAAADDTARAALGLQPEHPLATSTLITALLMRGDAEQALQWIMPMRTREPLRQHWIAYQATALRLCNPSAYARLVDLDRLVRVFELPTPPDYDSLEHFNQVLCDELNKHHYYKSHPLDQSLRAGSQTSRDLRAIDTAVLRDYFVALDQPIRRYLQHIGQASDHPLTARNTGNYTFAGCWSVRLSGRGNHINHVHPEGWISSAYYVSVPPETNDEHHKPGWIGFAEPPFKTVPDSPAQKWLQPRSGMVVLFPSYLWHGTTPINADSIRVTAPFDLIPAP